MIPSDEKTETAKASSNSSENDGSFTMYNTSRTLNVDKADSEDNDDGTKFEYTPEEKKLLRKINLATAPFIFIIILLQYLDKMTLNYSVVLNLFEDTGITGDQFSWIGAMYYVGYFCLQLPNQYLLQKVPISKYLGTTVILWGITLACTALAKNFSQLAALRFLLGFFEAAAYPCVFVIVSIHYRRTEQVFWMGMIPTSTAIGAAFGGLIGYGFFNLNGVLGMSAWKWYMIILGCLTSFIGVVTFIFLPDKARSRWFRLTAEELDIVDERIRDNTVVQTKEMKVEQIYESLREIHLYCYCLINLLLNLLYGAMSVYSTLILETLGGFSGSVAILLSIPASVVAIILIGISIVLSRRFNDNGYVAIGGCLLTMGGVLLLLLLPVGSGAIAIGVFLTIIGPQYGNYLTMVSNNVSGYTKRIFYSSVTTAVYCVGNFIGPLLMRDNEAPRYTTAMVVYLAAMLISALLFLFIRWTYVQENKRRQKLKAENKIPPRVKNRETIDMTDKEDLYFLYRP